MVKRRASNVLWGGNPILLAPLTMANPQSWIP